MTTTNDIRQTLAALKEAAPAGYALAFHVRFTTPSFLFQTYPKAWADYYSQNGLVMRDPTVAWGFENEGTRRWSDLAKNDPDGVMALAADYGLKHGVTHAMEIDGSRSLASFARADREFTDAEVTDLQAQVSRLHVATAEISALSPELKKELQKLSVNVG